MTLLGGKLIILPHTTLNAMKNLLFSLLLSVALICGANAQTLNLGTTVLTIDTVYTGLDVPWEITWGPDGMIWTTEREGIVSRIDPVNGTKDGILDITGTVYAQSESGLLGLALHPQFPDSAYVYLAYTYLQSSNVVERLVRYEYDGTDLVSPDILIDGIIGNTTHDGARLVIGPDDKLYMTTGDAQNQSLPQNVTSLSGKVLRINLDGTIPADNPISGSYVYSWGHRNAQGMVFAPNGTLYSSEHGPTTDDEVNIITQSGNYGWPTVAGYCDSPPENSFCADSGVTEPIFAWTPTIAPGDLTYYDHPAIPEWQGSLLLTILKNKQLIELELNAAGEVVTNTNIYLNNQYGRLRDILVGPNGEVYIATNGASWSNIDPGTHSIIRLRNNNYNSPLSATISGSITQVCEGDTVELTAVVTGGVAPYSYQWSPGAGLDCDTCVTVNATPTGNTSYSLTVTDDNGDMVADTVDIAVLPDTLSGDGIIVGGWTTEELDYEVSFNVSNAFPQGGTWQVVWEGNSTIYDTTYYNGVSFTEAIDPMGQNTLADCIMPVAKTTGPYCCYPDINICFQPAGSCQRYCLNVSLSTTCWGSTNDVYLADQFSVYPNPVNNILTISNSRVDVLKVDVMNILGQQIMTDKPTQPTLEHQLDLSVLKTGIYLVQVETSAGSFTKRIMKE